MDVGLCYVCIDHRHRGSIANLLLLPQLVPHVAQNAHVNVTNHNVSVFATLLPKE